MGNSVSSNCNPLVENRALLADRALQVLASTASTGEYIANGIWGRELQQKLADPAQRDGIFLMDVRPRERFERGHIEGAYHVEFYEWLAPERLADLPREQKIVVLDDTGNLASQVVCGLRLLGYDAAMLRTGMNGWAPTDLTEPVITALQSAKHPVVWELSEPLALAPAAAFSAPLPSQLEPLHQSLQHCFAAAPQEGAFALNIIQPDQLRAMMADPSQRQGLFLLDVRREEDFEGVGQIEGALRLDFEAALVAENLERLPCDKKIVTTCYTGNLAAQLAVALRLLGYDAAAANFGMVGWKVTPTTSVYLKDIRSAAGPLVTRSDG